MLKVLMLQLPVPGFTLRKPWNNIPLAAGFLSAMARKSGLEEGVDIRILERDALNMSADARMVDIIASRRPDVLCFSLYSWNSMRSLFIASEVKKRAPRTMIVAGGPEVTGDKASYIARSPAVDVGCIGEGESAFVEIIASILERRGFKDIRGIFYRRGGKTIVNPERTDAIPTDEIPSPYLTGTLNLQDYGCMMLEMERGCANGCAYCSERLRKRRAFAAGRVIEEARLALSNNAGIFFIESNLLSSPYFKQIFGYLKNINRRANTLRMWGDICAEGLSGENAALMKKAGIGRVNVGLQSVNPGTLRNIGRPYAIERFLNGVSLLKKNRIDVVVDIIIGLPEDTVDDFKRTVKFLRRHSLRFTVYVLKLEPGTELREKAASYGIRYLKRPPYRMLSAPYLSKKGIRDSLEFAMGRAAPDFPGDLNLPFIHGKRAAMRRGAVQDRINKVIIDSRDITKGRKRLKKIGSMICRSVSCPFTLWFRCRDIDRDLPLLRDFCAPIAEANPYLVWNVIVQTSGRLDPSVPGKIRQALPSKEDVSDYSGSAHSICLVVPWSDDYEQRSRLSAVEDKVPVYRHMAFTLPSYSRQRLERSLREGTKKGLLIEFTPSCSINFALEILLFIRKHRPAAERGDLRFTSVIFSRIFSLICEEPTEKGGIDNGFGETIAGIDEKPGIFYYPVSARKAMLEWLRVLEECRRAFRADSEIVRRIDRLISGGISRCLDK